VRADRIDLVESGGPLPPRYQYSLEIHLNGSELSWKSDGAANPLAKCPQGTRSVKDSELLETMDAPPPPPAGRVGVSYNSLTFTTGEETTRIEYLLNALDDDSYQALQRRVDALKALVLLATRGEG
jgi:hypothetical protein